MELAILDPFGDYATAGYLRNHFREKSLRIVGHLETAAFEDHIHEALRDLRRQPVLRYADVTETRRTLFESVYPWAGQDRLQTAPHLNIVKAGYKNLFALPVAVRRATEYALDLADDATYLNEHPGEVFGYLAHAHPFLEGNGRTILSVYSELSRRAGFYIEWQSIGKQEFLQTLTAELLNPGKMMDALVLPHVRSGTLPIRGIAAKLQTNFITGPGK